jgi:hypothetical protein
MSASAILSSEEWIIPGEEIPIRQGDVVISRDATKNILLAIYIILTADCDFARNKFGSAVAALRVISFREYLLGIWSERQLTKILADEQEKIVGQFGRIARESGKSAPSADAVLGWIERESPETIAASFGLDEKEARKFARAIVAFSSVRKASMVVESEPTFDALCRASVARGDGSSESMRARLWGKAKAETHPDDIFYLNSLPQIDGSGYVALLRDVVAIPVEKVVVSAEKATDDKFFLRVGRLQPTFKYALSQGFAGLYSRIGLPAAYELARKSHCANVKLDLE